MTLIDTLLDLQDQNPGKSISRDFFLKETDIPKGQIIKEFGTFLEFKRQANLSPSRKETKFLGERSKWVASKKMWDMGLDRLDWATKFENDSNDRFQFFLVTCDQHDLMCDPFYRRMTIAAADDIRPHKIIFNGDLMENSECSNYRKRATEYKPVERKDWVHRYFSELRDASPNSEFNWIEGNHEWRFVSHMMENSPAVMDILASTGVDLMGFLGLKEYQVNYHARGDFAAFTEADIKKQVARNYYMYKDFVLFHHFPEGKRFGMPGCSGHNHKYESVALANKTYGSYNWHHLGGGVRRHVDYFTTMGENWSNVFMIVMIDIENKQNTVFTPVDCTKQHCFMNGVIYSRTDEEMAYLVS